jgi:hypothetical protein
LNLLLFGVWLRVPENGWADKPHIAANRAIEGKDPFSRYLACAIAELALQK